MTDPRPTTRPARFAWGWVELEQDLLENMLRCVYRCEKAEADTQALEAQIKARVDKQFIGRATIGGTTPADYYTATMRGDQQLKDLISKQQWLDKRATMYATALLAVQQFNTRHPTMKLPTIELGE